MPMRGLGGCVHPCTTLCAAHTGFQYLRVGWCLAVVHGCARIARRVVALLLHRLLLQWCPRIYK